MLSVLLYGFVLIAPMSAQGIEGLPGSTWGILTDSVNGLTGSGGMGWVNQGIDWITWPGGITFNTYAEYRYRNRTKQNQYYDAQGPALGFEFKKSFLRMGMDYYWEKFPAWPGGVQHSNSGEFYLTGYYDWDLNRFSSINITGVTGLPGAIWADLTYDAKGLTGSGATGWVNQGIDWTTLPGGIRFNTFAEYRYRHRTKQNQYYDAQGPALGLEFKKSFLRLGMDYYWESYPESFPNQPGRSNYLEFYLSWYIDWDLKKLMK
jgi:hypothetical protein